MEETGDGNPRQRLTANHLRAAHFPTAQHGYDPEAVHDYLDRIADELLRLQNELHAAYAETERIIRHLHRWQNDQATLCQRSRDPGSAHRTSRDRWPINPS
ncbi:MAG TPA: DivIVA domain-containing protein [Micromonosporaceae bacterium]|nr:DivIVA domain-containing protein [Micromonosporaceae bacterium]